MSEAQNVAPTQTNAAPAPPAPAADASASADRAQLLREAAAGRAAAKERDELRKRNAELEANVKREGETKAQREARLAELRERDPRAWLKEATGHEATEIAALMRKRAGAVKQEGAGSPEVAALTREIEALKKSLVERDAKDEERSKASEAQRVAAEQRNVHVAITRHLEANAKDYPHFRAEMAAEGSPAYWQRVLHAYVIKNNPKFVQDHGREMGEADVSAAFEKHYLTRYEKRSSVLGTSKRAPSQGAPQADAKRATDEQKGNGPRTLTNDLSAARASTTSRPQNAKTAAEEREERIRRAIAVATRS